MNVFFSVIYRNILPVFLIAGAGFLVQRRYNLDTRTLSGIVINILSPCLVFSSLVKSELPGDDLLSLALFTTLSILVMGGLAFGLARLLRLERANAVAFLLAVMFVNGGNYGLTLVQLRYGEIGLSRAVVYFVTSTLLLYTLGFFIASMGHTSWRGALKRLLSLPAFYAALLAVIVYTRHIPVPEPVLDATTVAGSGAIPVMLLLLGMQLATLESGASERIVWPAVSLRLLGGPLIGLGVATFLGLQGLDRSAMIIEASMPPAVFVIVLSNEFNLPVTAVTRIVVFSTLLSPLTVAATITLMGL